MVKQELDAEPGQALSKKVDEDEITQEVRQIVRTQVKKEIEKRVQSEVHAKVEDVLREMKSPGLAKVIEEANEGHFDSDEAEEEAAQAHLDQIKQKRALKTKAKQLDEEYDNAEKEAQELHEKKLKATEEAQ